MDIYATKIMETLIETSHDQRSMPERVKKLLAQIDDWCSQERGRRAEIARFLDLPLSTVSAWFREYKKDSPKKQPTGEQVLALQEFLIEQRKPKRRKL
jgi:hypothetical protein